MTFEELQASLQGAEPPAQSPPLIEALWWQARGDWERAHLLAQDVAGKDGAWVHAYLHRCEGDLGNAAYWYRQAGQPVCRESLTREWSEMVRALLERASLGS